MFHKTLRVFSASRSFLFLYLAMVVLPAKSLIIDEAIFGLWSHVTANFISTINDRYCRYEAIEMECETIFPWEELPDHEWYIAEEPFESSFNGDMRNETFAWIRFSGEPNYGMPSPELTGLPMEALAPQSSEDSLQLLLSGNFRLRFYPGTKDLWESYRSMAIEFFNWLKKFEEDASWVNIDKKNTHIQWTEKVEKAKKYFQYASTLSWLCHGYVSQKMLQRLIHQMRDLLTEMKSLRNDTSVMMKHQLIPHFY